MNPHNEMDPPNRMKPRKIRSRRIRTMLKVVVMVIHELMTCERAKMIEKYEQFKGVYNKFLRRLIRLNKRGMKSKERLVFDDGVEKVILHDLLTKTRYHDCFLIPGDVILDKIPKMTLELFQFASEASLLKEKGAHELLTKLIGKRVRDFARELNYTYSRSRRRWEWV